MDRLLRLREHPIALILIWIPAIALLPGDWITIGNAVTSNANVTRLVLALAGLGALLYVSGRLPFGPHKQPASTPKKMLGPEERRERLDNLLYRPRDDRRELGEQCAFFAMKMGVFNEEQEWKREERLPGLPRKIAKPTPI